MKMSLKDGDLTALMNFIVSHSQGETSSRQAEPGIDGFPAPPIDPKTDFVVWFLGKPPRQPRVCGFDSWLQSRIPGMNAGAHPRVRLFGGTPRSPPKKFSP